MGEWKDSKIQKTITHQEDFAGGKEESWRKGVGDWTWLEMTAWSTLSRMSLSNDTNE